MSNKLICPSCGHENLLGEDTCAECQVDLHEESMPSPRDVIQKHIREDLIEVLCTHPPNTVSPDTSLRDVLKIMREKNIASVVVGAKVPFDGIFTERDFLYKVVGKDIDLDDTTVGELMTRDPAWLVCDQPIAAAFNCMSAIGVRHIPVARDGKLAEVLSARDLVQYLQSLMQKSGHRS